MQPKFKIKVSVAIALGVAVAGVSIAAAEKPDLEAKIDSAQSEASLISSRISAQSARIAELQLRAAEAAARERQLLGELRASTARSSALNDDLLAAERELEAVRLRYQRAVRVLSERLVAIYKDSEPDALTVILESDGYEELSTRAEYLQALTDSDQRIADRVSVLHDEVGGAYREIAGLKSQIDEQARELEASRAEIAAVRAGATQRAAEIAVAKAGAEAALGELRERISGWELEVRKQAAEQIGGDAGDAFLGGPYSIPTYIVICESGGNYRALNPSSGAGGAYQILPSTWRAYGGRGLPHLASKAEQDRIAAIIWREAGPGAWSCA